MPKALVSTSSKEHTKVQRNYLENSLANMASNSAFLELDSEEILSVFFFSGLSRWSGEVLDSVVFPFHSRCFNFVPTNEMLLCLEPSKFMTNTMFSFQSVIIPLVLQLNQAIDLHVLNSNFLISFQISYSQSVCQTCGAQNDTKKNPGKTHQITEELDSKLQGIHKSIAVRRYP